MSIGNTSGRTSHFHRYSAFLFLFVWFSLSGNVFAQSETDSLEVLPYPTDASSSKFRYDSSEFFIDTIPRFYNRIAEFGFGLTFPLRDFHASDPTNEFAGYALQGFSLNASVFTGFSDGGRAGWFFGAAYSHFKKSETFADSLRSIIAAFEPAEGENQEGTINFSEDFRPRYDIFSLRSGFAFEGSDERVSAFGGLLLNINLILMNPILLRTDGTAPSLRAQAGKFRSSAQFTTGISATFGLRFQQQLSVGITWHYLGTADLSYVRRDGRDAAGSVLRDLPLQRRIHFLEVKLGYGIAKRSGEREPKVKLRY